MYNGSIAFPVDKFPYPISHLISICIVSSPFVPTNHSSPFSISICSYITKCDSCQPQELRFPGAAPESRNQGPWTILY